MTMLQWLLFADPAAESQQLEIDCSMRPCSACVNTEVG